MRDPVLFDHHRPGAGLDHRFGLADHLVGAYPAAVAGAPAGDLGLRLHAERVDRLHEIAFVLERDRHHRRGQLDDVEAQFLRLFEIAIHRRLAVREDGFDEPAGRYLDLVSMQIVVDRLDLRARQQPLGAAGPFDAVDEIAERFDDASKLRQRIGRRANFGQPGRARLRPGLDDREDVAERPVLRRVGHVFLLLDRSFDIHGFISPQPPTASPSTATPARWPAGRSPARSRLVAIGWLLSPSRLRAAQARQ